MSGIRFNRRSALLISLVIGTLTACGGNAKTTTVTPTAAALIQATQAAPSVTATPPSTPTPLANALPRATTLATEAGRATGAATTSATNAGTPTPLARTTSSSGTNVSANTGTSSSPTARGTQAAGSATTASTTAASGSVVTGTGAAGTPTTTPVPATEARGATEQFLRAVLAKGDISGYLTPALQSQVGNDGYKLLNIQPPVQSFTIDSEQRDADSNGATVTATITTASGVAKRTFVMRKQGATWLVDNVLG